MFIKWQEWLVRLQMSLYFIFLYFLHFLPWTYIVFVIRSKKKPILLKNDRHNFPYFHICFFHLCLFRVSFRCTKHGSSLHSDIQNMPWMSVVPSTPAWLYWAQLPVPRTAALKWGRESLVAQCPQGALFFPLHIDPPSCHFLSATQLDAPSHSQSSGGSISFSF